MGRWKYSIVPVIAALAALFLVLPSTSAGAEIEMTRAFRFEPEVVRIEAGGAVTFVNESAVTHTASCDGCPWDTGDLQPGQRKTLRLDRAQDYRFFCRYHGLSNGMIGALRVGGAPLPGPDATPTVAPTP